MTNTTSTPSAARTFTYAENLKVGDAINQGTITWIQLFLNPSTLRYDLRIDYFGNGQERYMFVPYGRLIETF